MEAISSIGLLAFLGSIVFLIYHLIRKVKNRERKLPKKVFYPILIGGFLLFIIVGSVTDTSVQDELEEVLGTNNVLAAENKEAQTLNAKLEGENVKLNEDITKLTEDNEKLKADSDSLTKELDELTLKFANYDIIEQELKDLQATHEEKTEASGKEITELKATNSTLTSEVDSLKTEVANKSTSSAASSSGGTAAATPPKVTTKTPAAATSAGSESFQNCTELRKKYPNGVASDHPAYQSKMDRDKDGWACER